MILWLAGSLFFTQTLGTYLSRKELEKADKQRAIAACLFLIIFGGIGIELLQYEPYVPAIAAEERDALARMADEQVISKQPVVSASEEKSPEASNNPAQKLEWVSIKEAKYSLGNGEHFIPSKNSPFVSYRADFLNKTKKIIIGVELEVVSRNCSQTGGNRVNCPIETGPTLDQRTNILLPPNGHIPLGTYAPVNGNAEDYVMDVKVKRVAFHSGEWPKNINLVAATDFRMAPIRH
jgi:hypothetical protein